MDEFESFRDKYVYVLKNGYDSIPIFIELNELNDNEFQTELNIKKKPKKIAFRKKINDIKIRYNKFNEILNTIHMSQYHRAFINNGIYTIQMFKEKYKTVDDLKAHIKAISPQDSPVIFKQIVKMISSNVLI
mmetsp:Transcript_77276/g.94757  ORF Transcript_77276/g.94757 Transcript_77276/m.94757 type:complete len:132 (+) Transcript_77276:1-396(+)